MGRAAGCGVLLAVLTLVGTVRTQPLAPADLAASLQQRYQTIKDFTADFRHTYTGSLVRETVERGTLTVKKPGKMRWEYKTPEEKLFISDGVTMYQYFPRDRQVIVQSVPQDYASTPVLFLSGRGDLTRDFTASFTDVPKDMPQGSRALKLVPKSPQAEYEALVLTVDAATYTLRGLTALDAQGGSSTFVFSNLKENVNPADRQFQFTPPRGVEVFDETRR